jgi:uncharacterized protein (DUF1501 family)
MTLSRRGFLRGAFGALGMFGAAAAMNSVLGSEAFAATLGGYGGYRALVTVFLLGGNDGNNLLVPLSAAGYGQYIDARPDVGLLWDAADPGGSELLPLSPAGLGANSYGVHYQMPNLAALFGAGKAAFVCNAGPLVLPMKKGDYTGNTVQRPDSLFSHLDQQNAWASAIANPSQVASPVGPTGWGGRVADRIAPIQAGDYPEVVSLGGRELFGVGQVRSPLTMGGSGQIQLTVTNDAAFNDLRDEMLPEVFAITNSVRLEEVYGSIGIAGITYSEQRNAARDTAWSALPTGTGAAINAAFGTATANDAPLAMGDGSLRAQLYQVVRDIVAGATKTTSGGLGLRRQMFSVGLGGFDTHTVQRSAQDGLLAALDMAIASFQAALEILAGAAAAGGAGGSLAGLAPQATLFTMSDFGRTLAENQDDGTDHAWGNHMIVVGSQVAGNKLYGAYPNLDLSNDGAGNNDSVDGRGRWIPTLCVEQVANTLARWLGATSAADRQYMFPNLDAFVTSAVARGFPVHTRSYQLGFMLPD